MGTRHRWPDPKHHKKLSALLNIPVERLTPPDGPRAKGANNGQFAGKGPRSAAHAKVGKAIADAREAKELSVQDTAKKLGVSDASVYAWENGRWAPAGKVADKLAKLLAVPLDQLQLPKPNGHAPTSA